MGKRVIGAGGRVSVRLTPWLERELRELCARCGVSASVATRAALERFLREAGG